jgi:GntR family transcriptional regulator
MGPDSDDGVGVEVLHGYTPPPLGNNWEKTATRVLFFLDRWCTTSNNTAMLPFSIIFQPGLSLYEQVIYAAKKAIVSGKILPRQAFPSVRTLSTELKINPNTAHKVVTHLLDQGLLEVRPGTGTVVAAPPHCSAEEKAGLINHEAEQLVVEAMRLGFSLAEVTAALIRHWQRLEKRSVNKGAETK